MPKEKEKYSPYESKLLKEAVEKEVIITRSRDDMSWDEKTGRLNELGNLLEELEAQESEEKAQ